MDKFYRILDANLNRISEGIRVLEDCARFYYNDVAISEELKKLRHAVRKKTKNYFPRCIFERDSWNDIGPDLSKKLDIDYKRNIHELLTANFKRVQEGLRTAEEVLKVTGDNILSREFEGIRYQSYSLEKEFFNITKNINKKEKLDTELYCITAEQHSNGRDNLEVVREMIDSGIKIIQYREKEKSISEKYKQCKKIRYITADAGVTFIVNDHIDIALSVGADGVHLGQDDMPIEKARELTGEGMLIGVSTHSPEQAQNAIRGGADYIGVGPIFKTYTKKDVCDPVGFEYLEYAVKNIDIPFVAIGGIKLHNLNEVKKRGAGCIAMVTEITAAENIGKMIENIRSILKGENINEL